MSTTHRIITGSSAQLEGAGGVDLIVTSPPYPMIEMWDTAFAAADADIERALRDGDGNRAFEAMHRLLDPVWSECFRLLREGGTLCLNVGDATRSVGEEFRLYSNHSRILHHLLALGFRALPDILWRKQTNAPNKFMGSGMLPAGAYVTLEHEYILILRKGRRRDFATDEQKQNRRQSALFWEERNVWYSDVWTDLKGTGQELASGSARKRSAAFPFELAHRLVSMFSVRGDQVLDPFLGTGTTMFAAMAAGRHSTGVEMDATLLLEIHQSARSLREFAAERLSARLQQHRAFVAARSQSNGPLKYINRHHGFPVMTKQETDILLRHVASVEQRKDGIYEVSYGEEAQLELWPAT